MMGSLPGGHVHHHSAASPQSSSSQPSYIAAIPQAPKPKQAPFNQHTYEQNLIKQGVDRMTAHFQAAAEAAKRTGTSHARSIHSTSQQAASTQQKPLSLAAETSKLIASGMDPITAHFKAAAVVGQFTDHATSTNSGPFNEKAYENKLVKQGVDRMTAHFQAAAEAEKRAKSQPAQPKADNGNSKTIFDPKLELKRLEGAGEDPMSAHLEVNQMIKKGVKYLTSPYMTDSNPDEIKISSANVVTRHAATTTHKKLTQAQEFALIMGQSKKKTPTLKKQPPILNNHAAASAHLREPQSAAAAGEKAKISARFAKERAYFQNMADKQKHEHQAHAGPNAGAPADSAMAKAMPQLMTGALVVAAIGGLVMYLNKLDEDDVPDEERGALAVGMKRASRQLQTGTGRTGAGGADGGHGRRSTKGKQQYQQYQQKQQQAASYQAQPSQHATIADSWTMVGEDTDLEFATNFEVSDEVM
jgi:hypothetical protein